MNNGISGYSAGGVDPYRQIEPRTEVPLGAQRRKAPDHPSSSPADLGPDLSDAEAGMIGRKFPEADRLRLRLYGPGGQTTSVEPGDRGRRLDLRG